MKDSKQQLLKQGYNTLTPIFDRNELHKTYVSISDKNYKEYTSLSDVAEEIILDNKFNNKLRKLSH